MDFFTERQLTWIELIQAIGPSIVALIALVIASMIQWRQWKTAKDKLFLDLFDKRFESWTKLSTEASESEMSLTFAEKIELHSKFDVLFPKEIASIAHEIMNLHALRSIHRNSPLPNAADLQEVTEKLTTNVNSFNSKVAALLSQGIGRIG